MLPVPSVTPGKFGREETVLWLCAPRNTWLCVALVCPRFRPHTRHTSRFQADTVARCRGARCRGARCRGARCRGARCRRSNMSTGASPVATAPPRAAASCAAAARARVSAAPSNIAIVMADNRPPVLSNPHELSSATLTYPMLSFALNALYACGHGYDVWYLRMSSERCNHATQGTRDASYCKLPAIASVLRSDAYSHVAFIDSDSFFLHRNVSIHELLVQYAPVEPQRAHSAHFGEPSAWFASDLPQLGDRPNGGFHVWRSSLPPPPAFRSTCRCGSPPPPSTHTHCRPPPSSHTCQLSRHSPSFCFFAAPISLAISALPFRQGAAEPPSASCEAGGICALVGTARSTTLSSTRSSGGSRSSMRGGA